MFCFAVRNATVKAPLCKAEVKAGLELDRLDSEGKVCTLMRHQSSAFTDFSRGFCSILGCSRAPKHVFRMEQPVQCWNKPALRASLKDCCLFPPAQTLLAPSKLCINHCHQVTRLVSRRVWCEYKSSNTFCIKTLYWFSLFFFHNVRTCWHCWGSSLTCKINLKFVLSVVFNEKCKQVGSLCSVLEQDLLLTAIGCLGFTLLGNHECFPTRLCHFQWNLL